MNLIKIKKIVLATGITLGGGSVIFAATAGLNANVLNPAKADAYTLILDKDNVPTSLTNDYQDNISDTIKTALDNDVVINLVNAKTVSNGFAQFASRGVLYNFNSNTGAVTGLNGIKVNLSAGSMSIRTAVSSEISNNGITLSEPIALTSGVSQSLAASNYFALEAGDNGATVTSIELSYACTNVDAVARLNGTYTGILNSDGFIYKMTLNNGSASITSVDKDTVTSYNGTATLTGNTLTTTFTSGPTYNFTVSSDSYSLTASEITLYRVYDVEDFESYSDAGQGWASNRGADSKYDGTGVKGNYYCDYYGTNTIPSPIGGSGWSMMGSTDYILFNSAKGYNNSKVAAFKGNSSGLRFLQLKAYYGIPQIIGKGNTLSFRARGAYNSSFANSSYDTTFKIFAYYNSKITSGNQGTRTEASFTIPAGSDWREYKMNLDSSKNYYAFAIYTSNSDSNARFTPIDDVKIYTHSPYAPVRVTGVTLNESTRKMSIGETHHLIATVAPANADNTAISWSSSNTSVATVDNTGLVTGVATGTATITVTTADGNKTASCTFTITQHYPSGTFYNYAKIGSGNELILLAIKTNGEVLFKIGTNSYDAEINNFNNNTLTIQISGSFKNRTIGYLRGTYNTNNSITGAQFYSSATGSSTSSFGSNTNSGNTFTLDTKYFNNCDGTTAQLQSTFTRRYGDPWSIDNSNADRIVANTEESISNGTSLQLRGWAGGRVALTLTNDFSSTVSTIQISTWIYNPGTTDITVQVFGYKSANRQSAETVGSFTATAGQWTFHSLGLSARTSLYNIQFTYNTSAGTGLLFDNIALF